MGAGEKTWWRLAKRVELTSPFETAHSLGLAKGIKLTNNKSNIRSLGNSIRPFKTLIFKFYFYFSRFYIRFFLSLKHENKFLTLETVLHPL